MKHLKSNWMSNLKTQNEALADLILGILIFGILVVFVGLFVAPDKAAFVGCSTWYSDFRNSSRAYGGDT